MSDATGFSVRIFIPSGRPEGLRIIEKSNWTGRALTFPRAVLPEVRKREEITRTGVYILWGLSEDQDLPMAYVGEGETLLRRLNSHAKEKDFWTHGVAFTSKDQNLNKAHIQHLEARLVGIAKQLKRCTLDNLNEPQHPTLSEADRADAELFLADILLCLPVIGINFFEEVEVTVPSHRVGQVTPFEKDGKAAPPSSSTHQFVLDARGVKAHGYAGGGGFVVRKGSQAVKDEVPSVHPSTVRLRKTLRENGVLNDTGDCFQFTQHFVFRTPSTASAVVLGRSSNGRVEWKDASNTQRSLKDIEAAAAA